MGSRSGCAIFETFSEALQHLVQWKGCGNMCHVLDNLSIVSQTDEVADTRLATFLGLCGYLCVPVVSDKMEKGACIALLGVTLDTIKMEARLPLDKLDKYLTLVKNYRCQSHISVSQLESLTGLLNFTCRVVTPGRTFLRRLYSLKEGMKTRLPQYKLRLSAGTQDLAMWESFLHQYNGITIFGHNKALTAHQLGIQVAVNQEAWQVQKGGHFLNGRCITVHMASCVKSLGETLQDHRLVMEVADERMCNPCVFLAHPGQAASQRKGPPPPTPSTGLHPELALEETFQTFHQAIFSRL